MKALCRRFFIIALGLAWLAAISGCGPGVGGTGTGATPDPAAFGATRTSVCTAPFAAALNCPVGAGTPGTVSELTGTAPVRLADAATGGNVSATVDGNGVEFLSRCQGLQFVGTWGVLASGEGRFFGAWVASAGADALPASMSVAIDAAQPNDLRMTLFDGAGQVVFGPATLQPLVAPPTLPAVCP